MDIFRKYLRFLGELFAATVVVTIMAVIVFFMLVLSGLVFDVVRIV